MSGFDLAAYLTERRRLVDEALERVLPPEDAPPPTLHRAMRYSVMAGGKRLRPILVIAGCEAVGGRAEHVIPTACALELIHTYSLIHDDLPAMDDDDYRRGRLTSHKVFGDAIAILAGDALLTLAFRLIADNAARVGDARVACDVVVEIATAAGTDGMVGGQVADLESEGKTISAETLDYIHRHKTAALIRASLRAGAMLAGATPEALHAISAAGEGLGLAFQIVDDILDVEGNLEELGKTAGSDERKQKATYPALHGLEASRRRARVLIDDAQLALEPLGAAARPIKALADFVFERKS
ncbi:MAG: polyprenyl synthetase family protein [Candidatus Rokubacteria bacterium]|nr:polyprenyl synthetase family protein [Candidatus Rokubacteria bacterium]MBI4594355.1 polyprenyl synthetase family protein [Candidatus Rokubacteria bacterium]